MNRKFFVIGAAMGLALSAVLVACGGSSNSSSPSNPPTASAASGVLTAFGSVYVNGVPYAVDANTAVVDGDADDATSSTAALQVGMTVDVDAGPGTTRSANLVRFTSLVRGEVDALSGSSLTVLGQNVETTAATSFAGSNAAGTAITSADGTSAGSIKAGDYVVVYGYLMPCSGTGCAATTGATTIVATLIYEPGVAGVYRVEGTAENTTATSFTINGLTVDLSSTGASPTLCMPTPCAIANGNFVEVRSTSAPSASSPLTLTAARVKTITQSPVLAPGASVSLEGPLTQLNGTTFVLRGVTVNFAGVSPAPTLQNNQIVEVTGTVSTSAGTIDASAITVEQHATFTLTAPLSAESNGSAATPPTSSTLTVLGQVFTVNGATRFEDHAQNVRPFNLGNFDSVLQVGDQVQVSAYAGPGSTLVATRVERLRKPASASASVQGIVTTDANGASAATVTIAGVINANVPSAALLSYPGAGRGNGTLAGFIGAITANTSVVQIEGAPGTGSTITATDARVLPSNSKWVFAF